MSVDAAIVTKKSKFLPEPRYAYQQINLPHGSSPKLTFWLNVTASETATTPYDKPDFSPDK
jgi:hypothetical protein